jgi:hypothetical protein
LKKPPDGFQTEGAVRPERRLSTVDRVPEEHIVRECGMRIKIPGKIISEYYSIIMPEPEYGN